MASCECCTGGVICPFCNKTFSKYQQGLSKHFRKCAFLPPHLVLHKRVPLCNGYKCSCGTEFATQKSLNRHQKDFCPDRDKKPAPAKAAPAKPAPAKAAPAKAAPAKTKKAPISQATSKSTTEKPAHGSNSNGNSDTLSDIVGLVAEV